MLERLFRQVRERVKRGFSLKQLCRMKIRSVFEANQCGDILERVHRLKELSTKNQNYLTYNLNVLLADPERFYESTRTKNEPIWNSCIPPPPVN
jgi:hypothetical protein